MKKVIAVASGKGGVGKTSLALNLSIALSASGQRVSLLDADRGLANVNIMLGIQPQRNIFHMIYDSKRIADVAIDGPSGVKIIPGGNGVQELTRISSSVNSAANTLPSSRLQTGQPSGIGRDAFENSIRRFSSTEIDASSLPSSDGAMSRGVNFPESSSPNTVSTRNCF